MSDHDLLDLEQLLVIWVLAVQYLVNNFAKHSLKRFLRERRRYTAEDADLRVAALVKVTQTAVVLMLAVAAVAGAVGWFTE